MSDIAAPKAGERAEHGVSWAEAVRVWSRIAILSFGGPAGQIAVMHRILVDEKRWVSESRFLHALNYCMLLPGPEAQQLATYIGWLMHRTAGGVLAGALFILPGVVSIMALSIVYAVLGNVGIVAALFFGLKAAVLAIVLQAVVRVGKRALKNRIMQGMALAAFLAIFFFDVPFPVIVLTAGVIGFFGGRSGSKAFAVGGGHGPSGGGDHGPSLLGEELPAHANISVGAALRIASVWGALWLAPVALLLIIAGPVNVFSQIAIFFSKMAVVTFGGAYAVLAYVAQQAVESLHWLRPGEMLDGLGMAETTPGPLIMVLQFVGFMAAYRTPGALSPLMAGVAGGLLASWVTFTPCFLWIFLGAPFIERLRGNAALTGALSAITAAVVGVILNLAIWFAIHTIFRQVVPVRSYGFSFDLPVLGSADLWALGLSIAAVLAIFRFGVGMLTTLGACAATGIALYLVGAVSIDAGSANAAPHLSSMEPPAADVTPIVLASAGSAPGSSPDGCRPALTGAGGPTNWQVLPVPRGAIAETSREAIEERYPLCLLLNVRARDVEMSVEFTPLGGKVDQGAGLIARVQNARDYYVLRANALENNVRLYRVAGGVRRQFAGIDVPVQSGRTQRLGLRVQGDRFAAFLDDRALFEAQDSTLGDAGSVGLWTKADSLISFSNLAVKALDK
jgi:chromate transporter